MTRMKAFPLVLLLSSVDGFNLKHHFKEASALQKKALGIANHAVAICAVTGALLVANPQPAVSVTDDVYGSLETAIIEASDATYPVLQSLTPENISPLSNKIASILANKIPAEKLARALDGTANTLLSIPDDKLEKFVGTVKNSYQDISIESCSTIPFPANAASLVSGSEAVSKLDVEKVQKVADKVISPITQSIPQSAEKGICLPSKEGLEQIWIGQTKLALSIPTPIKQQFSADLVPAVKSIPSAGKKF